MFCGTACRFLNLHFILQNKEDSSSRCLSLREFETPLSPRPPSSLSLALYHTSCRVVGDSLSDRLKCWYLWTESSWHEFLIWLMNAHHLLMQLQRKSLPCRPRAAVSLSGSFSSPLLLACDCCFLMGRRIPCQASCVSGRADAPVPRFHMFFPTGVAFEVSFSGSQVNLASPRARSRCGGTQLWY